MDAVAACLLLPIVSGFGAPHSSSLVQAAWLRDHLADPHLKILDVTQQLDRKKNTVSPDLEGYLTARIPGAEFVDVGKSLSLPGQINERGDVLHNMLPTAQAFAEAMDRLGVTEPESHLVLYSSRHVMWATRVWWMLQSFGFRGRVSVLDGGLDAWVSSGLPVENDPPKKQPAAARDREGAAVGSFQVRSCRPGAFVDKQRVLEAIAEPQVALVDSLKPASFSGAKESRYGRRGHITSAVSVPYTTVVDPLSGRFLDASMIRMAFRAAGIGLKGEGDDERLLLAY
jgi:thiosulfate/3-mercaptopyruvate sulfurtransferase